MLDFYLKKCQTFEVYFQCHKEQRATYEALKSLRTHYPNVSGHLISDAGDDFAWLAEQFQCDYTYEKRNVNSAHRRQPNENMRRLHRTCEMYTAPWIVYMEDDVRLRDRISKFPDAHIAGPSGPRYTPAAEAYLRGRRPKLEINFYNGCGGCIFHRKSFLKAYKQIEDIKKLPRGMDQRIHNNTDALLTFVFLNAGFIARRWLDHGEEMGLHHGPASAFDHQFKKFYKMRMKCLNSGPSR